MVTELITFKMERNFLKDVDAIVKEMHFKNRTEFINTAIREKIETARKDDALEQFLALRGSSKKRTSDKRLHEIREQVVQEMFREVKLKAAQRHLQEAKKGKHPAIA